jgi:acetyl-CoA acetyltransferase
VTVEDVAIIGVGLHPFGRFGAKSAIDMAADAVRAACSDASVEWKDVQFAFGGSFEVDNPDAVIGRLGLTGIPFMDVYNGCATAATALQMTADAIRSGQYDIGVAVGMDKHEPGAFTSDPVDYGAPPWYGEIGHFLTTKFFAMKINRYMHDHGISHETLARVAAKNYRNGVSNPNAFRRKPIAEEDILAARMLNYPLTQYMFCSPDEGAAAAVLCRADVARRYTSTPIYLRATALRTRRYGAFEVHASWAAVEQDAAPTVYASRAAYEQAGIGPDDVDVVQLQDTDAGAEVIHMAENGFCADGEQEKLVAEGATEIDGPLPVNTDGGLIANGEPIGASGLRQIHELVLQLRGAAGDRQVPGTPRVGYAQLYGAPGTAGVSIVTT